MRQAEIAGNADRTAGKKKNWEEDGWRREILSIIAEQGQIVGKCSRECETVVN